MSIRTRSVYRPVYRGVARGAFLPSTSGSPWAGDAVVIGDSHVQYGWWTTIAAQPDPLVTATVTSNVMAFHNDTVPHGLLNGGRVMGFKSTDSRYNANFDITQEVGAENAGWTAALTAPNGDAPASTEATYLYYNLQRYALEAWWPHYLALAGWPFDVIGTGAFGGSRTYDHDDLWAQFLAGTSANIVIYNGGSNDIGLDHSTDSAAIISRYNDNIAIFRAAGKNIICSTVPGNSSLSAGEKTALAALNTHIRSLAANDLKVVDVAAVVNDGSQNFLSNMSRDGVHLSVLGSYTAAVRALTDLASVFPARDILPTSGSTTVNANPLLSGTGGTNSGTGVSGSVADNCTVTGVGTGNTVTNSKESRGDGNGSNQVVTFSPGAAGNSVRFETNHATTGLSAGDTVYAVAEIQLSNLGSNLRELRFGITTTITGGSNYQVQSTSDGLAGAAVWGYPMESQSATTAALQAQANRTLTVRTPNLKLTALPATLRVCAYMRAAAAGSGMVMKVGRVAMYKV